MFERYARPSQKDNPLGWFVDAPLGKCPAGSRLARTTFSFGLLPVLRQSGRKPQEKIQPRNRSQVQLAGSDRMLGVNVRMPPRFPRHHAKNPSAVRPGFDRCPQSFRYLAGDVVLDQQDVAERSVVGFRPDNEPVVRPHQARGDA